MHEISLTRLGLTKKDYEALERLHPGMAPEQAAEMLIKQGLRARDAGCKRTGRVVAFRRPLWAKRGPQKNPTNS